jgi:transcription initiation factor IIE alpha subunit
MSAATKPPVKSRLTIKDAACHRLVKFLMRAYYDQEHIVVVDCLLDLQVKLQNKVTEQDLSSALHLSPKMVREILHRLRQDQLVKGVQKSEALKVTEELTSRGKRKGYTRAPTVTFTWHIDFEHVVNVIKFRHVEILEKLSKTVDKSEVFYICPTLDCENHTLSKKRSVMDLLLDGGGHGDGVFRCDKCFTHDPRTNLKQATPLIILTHSETGGSADAATAAAAKAGGASAMDLGADPNENLSV